MPFVTTKLVLREVFDFQSILDLWRMSRSRLSSSSSLSPASPFISSLLILTVDAELEIRPSHLTSLLSTLSCMEAIWYLLKIQIRAWRYQVWDNWGSNHRIRALWEQPRCPLMTEKWMKKWYIYTLEYSVQFSSVQSLSRVRLFAAPWIAALQAFLSITNSWSSLKLRSIKSVMPSSHLILCCPPFLLPPIWNITQP